MSYFTKTSFWHKVKDTIQLVGTATQLGLIFGDSQHIYNILIAVAQFAGLILPIWLTDANNDGTIDGFEKEVVTTIKSDSPIIVETEVKKDTP